MRTALVYIPLDRGDGTTLLDGTAIQITPEGGGGFEGLAFIAPTADHPHGFVIVNETITITTGEAFENLDAIAGVAIFRAIIFEDTRFGISYAVKIGTREVVVQVGEDHADTSVALATLINAPDLIIPTPSGEAVTIGDVNARIAATIETYARINVDGTVPGTRLTGSVLVSLIDTEIGNDDWQSGADIALPDADGALPAAADHLGWYALTPSGVVRAIERGGTGKLVPFKRYGPDRVVLAGEPERSANEDHYEGDFAVPPDIADYDVDDLLWDEGSQVWLIKPSASSTVWSSYSGPFGFHHGNLFYNLADAVEHVNASGVVAIIGQGISQHAFISTGYTAAAAAVAVWVPVGVTLHTIQEAIADKADTDLGNVDDGAVTTAKIAAGAVTAEKIAASAVTAAKLATGAATAAKIGTGAVTSSKIGTAAVTSGKLGASAVTAPKLALGAVRYLNLEVADQDTGDHLPIKGDPNTSELARGKIAEKDIADAVIAKLVTAAAAYAATATYSRGGVGSMVTQGTGLWLYISGQERSSDHSPADHPEYWFNLQRGVESLVVSGSHRFRTHTLAIIGDDVFLATTNISTPRDATWIADHAGPGEEFIKLTGGGTAVVANPTGTDGDDLTRLALDGVNFNLAGATEDGGAAVGFSAQLVDADQTSSTTPSATTGDKVLAVTDDSTHFNMGGFTVATDAGRSVITPPSAGLYFVSFGAGYTQSLVTGNRRVSARGRIVVNDDPISSADLYDGYSGYFRGGGYADLPAVGASALLDLAATDTVTAYVVADLQAAAQTYTLTAAGSHFSIHRLGGGIGYPGNQDSDNTITGSANEFVVTDIDKPEGTWGFVNPGGWYGAWQRFLISELEAKTEVDTGDIPDADNSLRFTRDEEQSYYLGLTSSDKIATAATNAAALPADLKVRDN